MDGNFINFYPESYYKALEMIGGVKFTPREIDVLACLLSGKTAGTIASILLIEPRGVESHTRNIRQKLNYSARDKIIEFIENTNKVSILRKHYHHLLAQSFFKNTLKKTSKCIEETNSTCQLTYIKGQENLLQFTDQLKKYLRLAGIKIVSEKDKNHLNSEKTPFKEYIINIGYKGEDVSYNKEISQLEKNIIFVLLDKKGFSDILNIKNNNVSNIINIYFTAKKNYYLTFFELLKTLIPNKNFEKIIEDFQIQYEKISSSQEDIIKITLLNEKKRFLQNNLIKKPFIIFLRKSKIMLVFIIIFFIFNFIYIGSFFLKKRNDHNVPQVISSNLVIPIESDFLPREKIIKDMDDHLKNENEINTIALVGVVGIGGAGKTTLARYYGKSKKDAPIVWELNAETKESLIASYESLAYTLAKTEDLRKELIFIENIQKTEEREKQLLNFVKNLFKQYPNWVLIYDNVESFSSIKNYFPQDAESWGKGNVVITTRDGNIQYSGYVSIKNVIHVDELSNNESLTLLSKILYEKTPNFLSKEKQEEILNFLKNIPPFPLDVSVAAHYMKNNHINFEQYLKHLDNYNEYFEKAQKILIKEMTDYTKTRYGIINSAFESIINENKNFKDLLLVVCLLDSQNIPKIILEKYTDNITVEQFIKTMRKHGLVTHELTKNGRFLFSLHRSTQALGLAFLTFNLQNTSLKHIEKIIDTLNSYIDDTIEQEALHNINPLSIHIETFLSHKDILNSQKLSIIKDKLGYIYYYYLRRYDDAKKILEYQLKEASQFNNSDRMPLIKVILSAIYFELGEINKLHSITKDLLLAHKSYFKKENLLVARLLSHLGHVYSYIGENSKSKELLEQSLQLYEQISLKKHPGMARTLTYLGNTYRKLGLYQNAQQAFDKSFQLYKEFFPNGHADFPWIFLYLGIAHKELGNFERALQYLKQSLDMYQKYLPSNHQDIALPLLNLGAVYLELGDYTNSKIALEKSHKIFTSYFSKDHINSIYVLSYLGNFYRLTKEYEKSQQFLEESIQTYIENFGEKSSRVWRIFYHMGCLYIDQAKFEKAESILNKALCILKKHQHPLTYRCLESLGDLFAAKHQDELQRQKINASEISREKSKQYFKEALKAAQSVFSNDSPHVQKLLIKLSQ